MAKERAKESFEKDLVHAYGPCEGLPDLRTALREKLREDNKLDGVDVMVTTGANQAFINVVLSIADSSDRLVLFVPYYFNHLMALQMTEGGPKVLFGPCDSGTMLPDLDWLEKQLEEGEKPPKAVVVVTPNNPTGVVVPKSMLTQMAEMCGKAKSWLVVDNTYENFTYEDTSLMPEFISSRNVINIFSFSKCYGMMGWRMGYLAYDEKNQELAESLLKVQDVSSFLKTHTCVHLCWLTFVLFSLLLCFPNRRFRFVRRRSHNTWRLGL